MTEIMAQPQPENNADEQPITNGWINDYENSERFYSDATDTSPKEWADIHKIVPFLENDENTQPMPQINREDLEAVQDAATLEDALKAYNNSYSLKDIDAGKQSPQLCAEMLLRITDKFENEMTPEQQHAVAMETIAVGHAIGRLAELPIGEGGDRTSLKGLTELAEIMDIAQAHAPDEIPILKQEILHVAERIDSRVESESQIRIEPISTPIRDALEQFDNLPKDKKEEIPFTDILAKIEHDRLNKAEHKVEEKFVTNEKLFALMSESSPNLSQNHQRTPEATGAYDPSQDTAASDSNIKAA